MANRDLPITRKRSIFISGTVISVVGFICLLLREQMLPYSQSIFTEKMLDPVGFIIVLSGQYLRIYARGYKSEKNIHKDNLITSGPYALVRNPMYLGSFLIGFGMSILLLRLWVIPIYITLFSLWYWHQIHDEQQRLKEKFGQQYIDYCRQTPCFFPSLYTLITLRFVDYIPLRLIWIKKELDTILTWSAILILVEGYEDIICFSLRMFSVELFFFLLITSFFVALIYFLNKKLDTGSFTRYES